MTDNGGGTTIQLFKFTQNTYRDIGIFPSESNRNHSAINSKNWFFIICHAEFLISSAAYLWYEANSWIDYEMASFTCTSVVISIIEYMMLRWQIGNIFNHIENCERFIENSE